MQQISKYEEIENMDTATDSQTAVTIEEIREWMEYAERDENRNDVQFIKDQLEINRKA